MFRANFPYIWIWIQKPQKELQIFNHHIQIDFLQKF